ncbi:hypothetical protein ACFJGW_06745 [Burkholderiaceae bacterium UC74_6]
MISKHLQTIKFGLGTTFDPSRLSKMRFVIRSEDAASLGAAIPASSTRSSGTENAGASFLWAAYGLDFTLGPSGILLVEFHERYQDTEVPPNGIWNSGAVTISPRTTSRVHKAAGGRAPARHPAFFHSTALSMSSTTFLASPKTIIVLSM